MNYSVEDYRPLLVPGDYSLRDCIQRLDDTAKQILIVVDPDGRVLGTISAGDIRRSLRRCFDYGSLAADICNSGFFFARDGDSLDGLYLQCRKRGIKYVPILDTSHSMQYLLCFDALFCDSFENPVVVMAGGKGSRLGTLTANQPKPMLPVNGKPMLEILLERLIESGFHKFVFSVNYLKECIVDHFGDGSKWGIGIDYLCENVPLGTVGSLSLLRGKLELPFLLTNADVLTRVSYSSLLRYHYEVDACVTVGARPYEFQIPYGVISEVDGKVSSIVEKPVSKHLVSSGVYAMNPSVIDCIPDSAYMDVPALLEVLLRSGDSVSCFPMHEYWIDIGRPETLSQACEDLIEESF